MKYFNSFLCSTKLMEEIRMGTWVACGQSVVFMTRFVSIVLLFSCSTLYFRGAKMKKIQNTPRALP